MIHLVTASVVLTSCIRMFAILSFIGLSFFSGHCAASQLIKIAVISPAKNGNVNRLYQAITSGMAFNDNVVLHSRFLETSDSVEDIQRWLLEREANAVIFLGQRGLQFTSDLELDIPIITGAHINIVPNQSAVTLTADPRQLFSSLTHLRPTIKRIHVVFKQSNSGWIIKRAIEAAKINKLELVGYDAKNVKGAVLILKNIIKQANSEEDAIWLALDNVLPVKLLLPDILRQSWNKNLVIFSGNPYHVQQGTLFALYPNYSEHGRQLVKLAVSKIVKNNITSHETSQQLNSAINTRTASHLGVLISSESIESFNLVFPARLK